MLDSARQDLRFALRNLTRRPGFAAGAVLILALGIGANTAIFSVAHGVLLRPLPYAEPDQLVQLWPEIWINKRVALAVEEEMPALAGSTAFASRDVPITGGGLPEVVSLGLVSPQHFSVLGVRPILGRTFAPEERDPGHERVAVLSHGLWQRRYGGDPGILGRSIELDSKPYTVVGVMPAGHRPVGGDWHLWAPLVVDSASVVDLDSTHYLNLIARLAPGVTPTQAEAALQTLARGLRAAHGQTFTSEHVEKARVVGLHDYVVGNVRPTLWLLLGAVGFILLIACANVANLLLARAAARGREMAIRAALGAGRGRMVRQLLTESLLLGVLGGGAGLAVAAWAFDLLRRALPADLPRSAEVALDGPVLGFTLLASLIAALLFGLAPALRVSRGAVRSALGAGGRRAGSRPRKRLVHALVAFQVAASVVLLVGAGLLLRSLLRLQAVDPGFQPAGVLAMRLVPPAARYPEPAALETFYQTVEERLRALPGVRDVGAIHLLPLGAGNWLFPYRYEDQPMPPPGTPLPAANFRAVTPGYFRTAAIPLLRGRGLTAADHGEAPAVGLINQTLAAALWPGEEAVGKQIFLFGDDARAFTVVGVAGDVHQQGLGQRPQPEMYRPLAQVGDLGVRSMMLLARTAGAPLDHAEAVRAAVWSVDEQVPIVDMRPLSGWVRAATASPRFTTFLVVGFAGLALLLGMAGVYSVVACAVAQRTAEIGIRMALGAAQRDVVREVLGRGLRITLFGLVAGVVGALVLGRFLASQLYGILPTDATTYGAVALLIAAAALLSTWLPARRASSVEPVTALRHE